MAVYENSTSSDFINETTTVNTSDWKPSLHYLNNLRYKSFAEITLIVEVVLSILGIVCNGFVLCNLVHLRCCRGSLKTSLQFVMNLAVCDGFFAFVHVMRLKFDTMTVWDIVDGPRGRSLYIRQPLSLELFVGFTLSYLYNVMQSVALTTMMFIAVDLLILVKCPLRYAVLMAPRKGTLMITLAWVASFLVWACIAALYITPATIYYFGITFLIATSLPMCIGFIAFVVIYVIVTCGIRRLIKRTPSRHSRSIVKSAVTVACVLITYFICNMPILWCMITVILYFANEISNIYVVFTVYDTVRCLFGLNCILDPFIYSIRIPELRERLLSIFKVFEHFQCF